MHGPLAARSEGSLDRLFRALLDPKTSRTHYWAAAVVVGIWLMLAWGLHPWLGDRGSFLIFIPAVLFAAGFGGLGPGLLATALSVTLGVLLVGRGHLTQPAQLETIIFAVVGVGISWYGEQLRLTRIRDLNHAQDLRSREAHLRSILDGVGLSISKRIIEAHGGEMWAEPNPGGGTIFRFTVQSASESGVVDA